MKAKNIVWTVCQGDTGCDEPGYIAVCSVFATREAAMRCMENSVANDEECFETPAKWNAERDMAIIERGDGRQIVYTLNEEEVRA